MEQAIGCSARCPAKKYIAQGLHNKMAAEKVIETYLLQYVSF
jgi:hypothetical protein